MLRKQRVLLLEWDPEYVPCGEGSEVLCEMAAPFSLRKKEAAGASFHEEILRRQGLLGEARFLQSKGDTLLSMAVLHRCSTLRACM
jgi:hypothetical protein